MVYHTKKHTIDFMRGTITDDETCEEKTLTRRQNQILNCLYFNRGSWISREQIIDNAFGSDYTGSENQITQQISKIKQLLGDEGDIIENKYGSGLYRWTVNEEKPTRYSSFDGLKKCFEYCPDAKFVDLYTQTGRTLFTQKETTAYFRQMVEKGIRFRMMINSPEAVSVSSKNECLDYLDNYRSLASDGIMKDCVSIRVSGETFHERLFLAYRKSVQSDGVADVRKYHYSVSLPQSTSQVIRPEHRDFRFYVKEFQRLWDNAIPIEEYYRNHKFEKETWEYRLVEAYEKKEHHDYTTFINILQNLSDEGYDVAMYRLAICYLTGRYIEKNDKLGIALLEKAGKGRNRKALFSLGVCYWYGLSQLPQDHAQAVSLFRKLSDDEIPDGDACFYLYLAYRNGYGVDKDMEKAGYYRQVAQRMGVTEENVYELREELQNRQ